MRLFPLLAASLLAAAAGAADSGRRAAEGLLEQARAQLAAQPRLAEALARQALAASAAFDPTDYVEAGRKGEVVEDAYVAAREAYRRHRAPLYAAVGEARAAQGDPAAAARYLRRATWLEPSAARATPLARALVATGQVGEALDVLQALLASLKSEGPAAADLPAGVVGALEAAVDAAALPSAQAEIDRARLSAFHSDRVQFRGGPLPWPSNLKMSTGAPFRTEDGVTVFYFAETSCRTCSADLEVLKRLAPGDARIVVVPPGPDEDQALRQVLRIYALSWPLLLGQGVAKALDVPARSLLVVGRRGWSSALLLPSYAETLAPTLALLRRQDLAERLPRANWVAPASTSARPPRPATTPAPALLPGGLAPGEDAGAPPEFTAAVEAYRARRFADALRGFEAVEARGDGWLLPPEARLDRALCLAGLGRRDEARRLLLATGDSRFPDAVDRALEQVGTPGARSR